MYCKMQEESTWQCSLTGLAWLSPQHPTEGQDPLQLPAQPRTCSESGLTQLPAYWGPFIIPQDGNSNSHSVPFIHTNSLFQLCFMSH